MVTPSRSTEAGSPVSLLKKIISGGQTGADRAALDFALAKGLAHGGWCPHGRWAEDGRIPDKYHLTETPGRDPNQRTEWNVRDSDGTVIFSISTALSGGTAKTAEFANIHHKPLLHICRQTNGQHGATMLRAFINANEIETLNVAGPRGTEEPELAAFVLETLEAAL